MPTLSRLSGHQPAQHAPVFADVSGRRRRRMRHLGLGLGTALVACLTVMAVGLLGGPRAPLIPWTGLGVSPRPAPGKAGDGASRPVPNPVILPPASPSQRPGGPSAKPSGSGRSAAGASSSPAQVATNQAGRTPPGRNRSSSPRPSPSRHSGAV